MPFLTCLVNFYYKTIHNVNCFCNLMLRVQLQLLTAVVRFWIVADKVACQITLFQLAVHILHFPCKLFCV
uniref:Uncharacterized protein n=1 Tax=Salix viminalis TaxID=40686 RepID=A0A6N2L126_SALVM